MDDTRRQVYVRFAEVMPLEAETGIKRKSKCFNCTFIDSQCIHTMVNHNL